MNLNKAGPKVSLPSVKTGNKVKIGLPSLCSYGGEEDSGDEEEKQIEKEIESNPNLKKSLENAYAPKREGGDAGPAPKPKPEASGKKPSGLLSLLPPPKASMPISFLKKPAASQTQTSTPSTVSSAPATTSSLLLPRTLKPPTQTAKPTSIAAPSISKLAETKPAPVVDQKSSSLTFLQYGYDDSDDEESEQKYLKELEEKTAKQLAEAEAVAAAATTAVKSTKSRAVVNVPKPAEATTECKFEVSAEYGEDPELEFGDDDDDDERARQSRPLNINTGGVALGAQPELDEEAWQKLVGGKKRKMDSIEILDVNAKDIVGDATANLTKQITDEYRPANNRDYFSSGSKRKHQITYLAYVAKERDEELRRTWADAKYNRAQAKQKYGF